MVAHQQLLNLTYVTAASNLSAVAAASAASDVLAILSASNETLSTNTQAAALTVLGQVARAGMPNATTLVAQTVVSALSVLATSALNVSSAETLQGVQDVLGMLAASQRSSLAASMPAGSGGSSATTTSPLIQTRVQIDPPGSSRLTSTPLTAPGSPSAFAPMPANLLPSDKPICTQFFSLAFDPNPRSANMSTTGVTRLAFTGLDGSPIEVANASTPIRFTLPRVPGLGAGGGVQAVCSFWDPAAGAYATHGCAGVPNPAPANHSVYFFAKFSTPDDASLAMSWNISGPMVDDGSCSVAVIDCNAPRPAVIYPNPLCPLSVPAVACPPRGGDNTTRQPVLRVFYGANCQLWQQGNAYNCSWDNVLQAFSGGGCVSSPGPTQCMCRHVSFACCMAARPMRADARVPTAQLTDFASARVPTISTCSLSDMMSLSPGDIITKLKARAAARLPKAHGSTDFGPPSRVLVPQQFLFIVVISLFGFMNVGGVVAFFMDMSERRATLQKLHAPDTGFRELPDGTWVWRCTQAPLTQAVQAPAGSAMVLASIFGVPFVRLRAALPECLFAGSVGQALGRRAGLSVHGFDEARDDNIAVMQQLLSELPCCGGFAPKRAKIPALLAAELPDAEAAFSPRAFSPRAKELRPPRSAQLRAAPPVASMTRLLDLSASVAGEAAADATAEELVGTALVFAFFNNAKILPVVELSDRRAAACEHFRGVRLRDVDFDFEQMLDMFIVLLAPGNLSGRGGWIERSRLWRFLLLAREDGGWDMSESLAFALQAHEGARPPPKPKQSKLRVLLGALMGDEDLDDALDDAIEDLLTSSDDEDADDRGAQAAKSPHVKDCPLTFSRAAIQRRMPRELAALNDEWNAMQAAEARATHLAAVAEAAAMHATTEAERAAADADAEAAVAAALELQRLAALHLRPPVMPLGDMLDAASAALGRLSTFSGAVSGMPAKMNLHRIQSKDRVRSLRLKLRFPSRRASSMQLQLLQSHSQAGTASTQRSNRSRRPKHAVPVDRIWSTVLAITCLEELDSCWLVCDEPARTIVDAGADFLVAQARADRRVRRLLRSRKLQKAAHRALRDWRAIQAANVAALRDADVINRFTALTHFQRGSARVVRSLMTDHSTFATFLDEDGYIMRWQARSPAALLGAPVC